MTKLEKALKQWVSHGFIDQKQADQIHQYELRPSDTSWILSGLLILGAITIGIGTISVIAANWQYIPDMMKLIADFAILITLSLFIVRAWILKKPIQFEILLLSFLIFCLASIGLIAQIYHTGGELYQALMLWSFITFPGAMMARYLIVPFTWMGGFLFGIACTLFYSPFFYPLFDSNLPAILLFIPLFCVVFALSSKRFTWANKLTPALQIWFFISGSLALVAAETELILTTKSHILIPYMPAYLFAAFTILLTLQDIHYKSIQKLLIILTLSLFLLSFSLPVMAHFSFVHALFTILILGLLAILSASLKQRHLFQWILFFLGLRFLILYFQALGGLALTGLGLITSGILIITMVILWQKYKSGIAVWAERWMR